MEEDSNVCERWRSNLGAMTTTLKFVVSCDNLGLEELFRGTYFGHTMSKAC